MKKTFRKYEMDEFERMGDAIYEECVKPFLDQKDNGKYVAIDIESGEFEIDVEEMTAVDRLRARFENPQTWLVRVGSRYVRHFGGRGLGNNRDHGTG